MDASIIEKAQAILDYIDSHLVDWDASKEPVPEIWLERHIYATKLLQYLEKEDE